MSQNHTSILQPVTPPQQRYLSLTNIMRAVIGTAVLALAAKIQVPLWPVPITMQSFVVVMIGALYGARLSAATLILYLCEGAIGLPVFAGSNTQPFGFGFFMHPTAGYLVGFVVAAYVAGHLSAKGWGKTSVSAAAVFFIGLLVIEIFGDAWLSYCIGLDQAILAIMPYQIASIYKIGLGMCTLPLLRSKISQYQ